MRDVWVGHVGREERIAHSQLVVLLEEATGGIDRVGAPEKLGWCGQRLPDVRQLRIGKRQPQLVEASHQPAPQLGCVFVRDRLSHWQHREQKAVHKAD